MGKRTERGVYFDGWYKDIYCYHPSLPIRNMLMLEDLEKYHATTLLWSMMGGGPISLPWLEHEAFGDVDPRLRFYGFMNDSEFIAECGKRGINVYGIVFEVQGWEFPAVITKDENGKATFKAINLLRDEDADNHDWYGLREFTEDKHWEVFGKKLADYFPDGLYDSDGKKVENIFEEGCSVTYKGKQVHSTWVEVVGHKHMAYQMCRNNYVWRQYLKKIIEIMVDAGIQGIQLDEPELPMISMFDGGCFCLDCVKEFRMFLQDWKAKGKLPESIASMDLTDFDYGAYLRETGRDFPKFYDDVPLSYYYREYQLRAVHKYFKELVDHAREYSMRTRGDQVLVSANFTFIPICFPLWPYMDVIMGEMRVPSFGKPSWYRYMAGFGAGKHVIIAESPGGIIPELVESLDKGIGFDLYRTFLLEPSIFGCNMSVPYGAWMGNKIKNAFHPPRHVTVEIQDYLAEHERLFTFDSGADAAVVWSYPSYYWRENVAGYSTEFVKGDLSGGLLPFWDVIANLTDNKVCYDVLMMADGEMREDTFSFEDIDRYSTLILPDCLVLTDKQIEAVLKYAQTDGHSLVIYGRIAEKHPEVEQKLKAMSNVVFCGDMNDDKFDTAGFENALSKAYCEKGHGRVWLDDNTMGFHTYIMENGNTALHLINYRYDKELDKVVNIDEAVVTVAGTGINIVNKFAPQKEYLDNLVIEKSEVDGNTKFTIKNMPLYVALELDKVL